MDAMDRIRDEMAKQAGNPNVQAIGEYLTGYLRTHPGAARQLGAEGKSIVGALKALEEYARKQPRTGNCAMVDDQTAFRKVLKYYGIEGDPPAPRASMPDELDLDALLGL